MHTVPGVWRRLARERSRACEVEDGEPIVGVLLRDPCETGGGVAPCALPIDSHRLVGLAREPFEPVARSAGSVEQLVDRHGCAATRDTNTVHLAEEEGRSDLLPCRFRNQN